MLGRFFDGGYIPDRVLKRLDRGEDEFDYGCVALVVVERHSCVESRGDCITLPMISIS